MDVELLVVPDCPHAALALKWLRVVLSELGLGGLTVRTTSVTGPEDALARGFIGSPSFFVDGRDLFPDATNGSAMACRVYRAGNVPSGLPSLDELRRAVAAAANQATLDGLLARGESQALIRGAYEAYARGEWEALLDLVSDDLEWTFLDPAFADPEPRVCHGRNELRWALQGQADQGLTPDLEEIIANDDRVVVIVHVPGLDQHRIRQGDDRHYQVLTVQDGKIVAMRACRDRAEALSAAGMGP